jgi:hypothetical protein
MTVRQFGPANDARFTLHHRQPRANKLDARQRAICRVDSAYADALAKRVSDTARFSAFIEGIPFFINLEKLCPKCGGFRRRTRDRSCYNCHINRGSENFERMKAGVSPIKSRSLDSHLDLLERKRAEKRGEHLVREFGGLVAKRWPTGRLDVLFPNGAHEPDISKMHPSLRQHAMDNVPEFMQALLWAGWL